VVGGDGPAPMPRWSQGRAAPMIAATAPSAPITGPVPTVKGLRCFSTTTGARSVRVTGVAGAGWGAAADAPTAIPARAEPSAQASSPSGPWTCTHWPRRPTTVTAVPPASAPIGACVPSGLAHTSIPVAGT